MNLWSSSYFYLLFPEIEFEIDDSVSVRYRVGPDSVVSEPKAEEISKVGNFVRFGLSSLILWWLDILADNCD
jgi:hypothetical protein